MTGPAEVAFRCSTASAKVRESLAGTASTVRAFVLLETPGPWGVDAVRDSRLPEPVKRFLGRLEREARVRPLLIRRPGRPVVGSVRLFAATTEPGSCRLEAVDLGDAHEVLDLPLHQLRTEGTAGLPEHDQPVFAVCTHGRHDACCAEQGRPVCAALSEAAPEHTWEVSHIGGDRFAANVLVLPQGLYYGRLAPQDAGAFAAAHLSGELVLDQLRGRSAYPFAVQYAEIALRRHLSNHLVDSLRLHGHERRGERTTARFGRDGVLWDVTVSTTLEEPRLLTCRAGAPSAAPRHRLLWLTEVH